MRRRFRCDDFSKTQTFVHRMPSTAHEIAASGFAKLLFEGLSSVCRGAPEEEQFKDGIVSCRNADVHPKQGPEKHQPDDYFFHCDDPRHGIAVEVAYSQKSKEFEKLARFYLFESLRDTEKVIGISIDSNRSKRVPLYTLGNTTILTQPPAVCLDTILKSVSRLYHMM